MRTAGAVVANRLMTALVTPRPIAWIVTQDEAGRRNAAPFSFFNALCSWPPILGFGIQPGTDGVLKDTRANIAATGEFVVNLVPFAAAQAMNTTSGIYPREIDELALADLATIPSTCVAPPRIGASPVAFECRLRQTIEVEGGRAILLGDVHVVHVADDAVLDAEAGYIDATRFDLIARMHGAGRYLRASGLFELHRPESQTS